MAGMADSDRFEPQRGAGLLAGVVPRAPAPWKLPAIGGSCEVLVPARTRRRTDRPVVVGAAGSGRSRGCRDAEIPVLRRRRFHVDVRPRSASAPASAPVQAPPDPPVPQP